MPNDPDLAELDPQQLAEAVAACGGRPFNARQITRWLYRRNVTDPAAMTDLPAALRARLAADWSCSTPAVLRSDLSDDGTAKLLLGLPDGARIEAVYIPDTPRQTFCVSTQVGCAMQCGFCLTGLMGLQRHLTAGEIAGQVRVLAHHFELAGAAFNVVLMGMGEPLHNYDRLVPVNRKYGLADLIAAGRRFPAGRRRRITFEYVLLADVNDSIADAARLARLLSGMHAKVNVIPLNEAPGIPYRRPSDSRIDRFGSALAARGVRVMVRKSRGRDIRAACGQLIVEEPPQPGG